MVACRNLWQGPRSIFGIGGTKLTIAKARAFLKGSKGILRRKISKVWNSEITGNAFISINQTKFVQIKIKCKIFAKLLQSLFKNQSLKKLKKNKMADKDLGHSESGNLTANEETQKLRCKKQF